MIQHVWIRTSLPHTLSVVLSTGSVSWDEMSNYILAGASASDTNASKQEGGALLEGPEPDLTREIMHEMPIMHMCCHPRAERYISVALEDRGSAEMRLV